MSSAGLGAAPEPEVCKVLALPPPYSETHGGPNLSGQRFPPTPKWVRKKQRKLPVTFKENRNLVV